MSDALAASLAAEAAETGEVTIRAKWTIDGAATLREAAQKAREFAEYLLSIEAQGYMLREPVADDWGFCIKP